MIKTKFILAFIIISAAGIFAQNRLINNHFLLAKRFYDAAEYEKAKPLLEELIKREPDNYQYFETLNNVYIQLKEYDSSINLIKQQINKDPNNINLYGMLGTTVFLKGDEQGAYKIWEEALNKLPQSAMNYRTIANYAIGRRAFDKAAEYLKKGKDLAKNPNPYSFDLASIYSLTMGYKDAAEEYCSILKSDPNQRNIVQARILTYTSKPDALKATIAVFEDNNDYDNLSISYILARLYIEDNNFAKAYDVYKEIDDKNENNGVDLYNFAYMAYQGKSFKIAADAFKNLIDKYPGSSLVANAKLGYAKTLEEVVKEEINNKIPSWKPYYQTVPENSPRIDSVISAYRGIINFYPNSNIAAEAVYRIGEIKFLIQDKPDEAAGDFKNIIKSFPASNYKIKSLEDLGRISLKKGDLTSAGKYFKQISEDPKAPSESKTFADYQLAKIDFFKGNFAEANKELAFDLSDLKDNYANDAIELSLLLNPKMNDSTDLAIFAQAEFFAEQNNFAGAAEKFKIISENKQAFVLHSLAELKEAEMELALNNWSGCINLLQKISGEQDKNIYADKALYLLGNVYELGVLDIPKAIKSYENLLANYPNSLYLDDAREHIQKLNEKPG